MREFEPHPQLQDPVDVRLDDLRRQPKGRRDGEHAARPVFGLIDRHADAVERQKGRRRQPRRSTPDHGDPAARVGGQGVRLRPPTVRDRKPLERANGHRLVIVARRPRAARLAQVRAHVAGHPRQRVPRQDRAQCLVNCALCDQPGVLGHVLQHGALGHAGRLDAVKQAKRRVDLGQLGGAS